MRFSRAFAVTLFSRELSLASSFLNSILLARWLGAAGVGTYSLVVATASLASYAASLGIHSSNRLLAAQEPERAGRLMLVSVFPALLAGLVGSAVLAFAPGAAELLIGKLDPSLCRLVLAGTVLNVVQLNLAALLFGLGRYRSHGIVSALVNAATAASNGILVVAMGKGVEAALGAWFAWTALNVLVTFGILASSIRLSWTFDGGLFLRSLSIGFRAFLSSLFGFASMRGIFMLLNRSLGSASLGLYAVAVPLAETIEHIPNVVGSLVLNEAGSGRRPARDTLRFVRFHLLTAPLLGGIAALLAPWIIALLYGSRFEESAGVMRVLLLSGVFMGLWTITASDMAGRGAYPPVFVALSGLMASLTLGAGYHLIPRMGILGGAVGTACSAGCVSLLMLVVYCRQVPDGVRLREFIPRVAELREAWRSLSGKPHDSAGR